MHAHDHEHGRSDRDDPEHGHSHASDNAGSRAGHHTHHHAPADFGTAFAVGTGLNAGFVLAEATTGILANSMALLADAGHNLSDVLGLLMAWWASRLARNGPTTRYTYGLGASSILAALANAVLLLVAVGAIAWEAVRRLAAPEPPVATTMMIVALLGVLINGATAALFLRGRHGDLNVRGAFLHMLADAGISLGVVAAGLGILVTGWLWLDPAASLLIAVAIVWGTWGLLRDSLGLALAAVPAHIDPREVRRHLEAEPGVARLHDLHIWPMSTTETALTCHLVMPAGHPGDAAIARMAHALKDRFGIGHATLQIEMGDGAPCALEPENVV